MALELNKLTHAVDTLGENAARRLGDLAERLPAAVGVLDSIGLADEALLRKVQAALRLRWAGAIPTGEPVSAAFEAPAGLEPCTVIAADGSQIYPDRHGVALYYLINIGAIVFRCGAAQAPRTHSRPEVFYEDADLYDEDGGQRPKALIDAERDRRELAMLAELAAGAAPDGPTVALLDNGLLLYLSLQLDDRALLDEKINLYLDQLDALRATGAAVAGVVDRPRAASVVRLLHLSTLPAGEIRDEALRHLGPFQHLTDALLFARLAPGQRSALFVNASPANEMWYRQRGHSIHFFYLNAGRPGKDALLRVEVPEWVARDPQRLSAVHATILEQSRVSDGFPYVLMRAHELAVVTQAERREVDQMITGALIRRGLRPGISQKAQGKAWTGAGRRGYP